MQLADLSEVTNETFGDWQRDYFFKVLVLSEPKAPDYATLKGSFDPDAIDIFIDAFPLPASKVVTQRKKYCGQWAMFNTKLDSANTVQLTFCYDEKNDIHRFLTACHTLTGADDSAASVPKAQYVFDLGLQLYNTDKVTAGKGYRLHNAWVAELSDLSLDKTKDGLLTFTASIAYDKKQPL